MPLHLLTPVDAPGHLDRIFNSYLYHLRSLEQVVMPRLSMAARAAHVADDLTENTEYVAEMGLMLHELATLANSLYQLADYLTSAYIELEAFATECAGSLDQYTRQKQDEVARQRSRTRRKPSDWKAKPKDLAPFQLRTVLSPCFAGSPGIGEKIGASQAVDFSYHSDLLRNSLTFGLRDPGQPATPTNLITHRADEAVKLPAEQPDEQWCGYDVSLPGPEAVAAFEQVLQQCQQAATLYHSLAADDAAGYLNLFQLLAHIVDGENENVGW